MLIVVSEFATGIALIAGFFTHTADLASLAPLFPYIMSEPASVSVPSTPCSLSSSSPCRAPQAGSASTARPAANRQHHVAGKAHSTMGRVLAPIA
ncbi:MAG: hypothetical protein M3Z25_24125, partial [Actinomycetota bacterium]|nr:hypothetical protein [Actinomycetota bacterium]